MSIFRFIKLKKEFLQLATLIGILIIIWVIIHRPPYVPKDVYQFLTSLNPDLVLACQKEGKNISPQAWADLLAVKATLPLQDAHKILLQLRSKTPFTQLDWGNIEPNQAKTIIDRRNILLNYPYYEPGRYIFPVEGEAWYQDSFGATREGGKRIHEGTDLFAPEGTPIISVCSGTIEKLGWNRLGGERVGVRGEDGNYYYYAHLQYIAPNRKVGQRINKGDLIGTIGHTGDALTTPDHLHFGIELPNGIWINPYPFLYVWQQQYKTTI